MIQAAVGCQYKDRRRWRRLSGPACYDHRHTWVNSNCTAPH